jgi:hypothetical protein
MATYHPDGFDFGSVMRAYGGGTRALGAQDIDGVRYQLYLKNPASRPDASLQKLVREKLGIDTSPGLVVAITSSADPRHPGANLALLLGTFDTSADRAKVAEVAKGNGGALIRGALACPGLVRTVDIHGALRSPMRSTGGRSPVLATRAPGEPMPISEFHLRYPSTADVEPMPWKDSPAFVRPSRLKGQAAAAATTFQLYRFPSQGEPSVVALVSNDGHHVVPVGEVSDDDLTRTVRGVEKYEQRFHRAELCRQPSF